MTADPSGVPRTPERVCVQGVPSWRAAAVWADALSALISEGRIDREPAGHDASLRRLCLTAYPAAPPCDAGRVADDPELATVL
jgi:hypothetical protein